MRTGGLRSCGAQTLLPTVDGRGRVAAIEILIPDDAVRNLVRQGKVEQIYTVMQTQTKRGMQTMEQSLCDLVRRSVVARDVALSRSSKPDHLEGLIARGADARAHSAGGAHLRPAGA